MKNKKNHGISYKLYENELRIIDLVSNLLIVVNFYPNFNIESAGKVFYINVVILIFNPN